MGRAHVESASVAFRWPPTEAGLPLMIGGRYDKAGLRDFSRLGKRVGGKSE